MANQMPGPLRVDNDLGIRSNIDTRVSQVADTGIQRFAETAAAGFARIGERVGQLADKAAAKEGAEAGLVAGLDPEFRTRGDGTIFGEAFDKAGLDVAETRFSQQIENDFEAAGLKFAGDPGGLNAELATRRMAILANAPQQLKPGLELAMRGKQLAMGREQMRRLAAERAAEAEAAFTTQLDVTLKGIHQKAFALGLDAQADDVLAAETGRVASALNRRGPDGKRLLAPDAAAKLLRSTEETVATARLKGAFSRLPGLDAKAEFIASLAEDYGQSRGLAKVYGPDGFEAIVRDLEGDLRSARTEAAVVTRVVGEEVTAVAKMAEKGFAPPADELAALKARVTGAGDAEVAAKLSLAERTLSWQSSARKLTPVELDRFVQSETKRLGAGGGTPEEVARIEMAGKLTEEMRRELKQDALGWAERSGLVKVAPIDLSTPEATAATLKARMAQAEEVAVYYGQKPQYLRPEEKRLLATAASQGGGAMMAIATQLASAAGQQAPLVLAEVFDEAPMVATLGGLVAAAGVTAGAKDAADGIALAKTDGFKGLAPSEKEARSAMMTVTRGALSAMPKTEAAVIALANAAYEVRARRKGLTAFDDREWQAGLSEVVGGRQIGGEAYGGVGERSAGWFGSAPVIVPPDVKTDGFDELVDAIRMDDLVAVSGAPLAADGTPLSLASVQRARLVTVGLGKYELVLGEDADGSDLKAGNSSGDPYQLDLEALKPRLKARRPDLYLGGG